MSNLMTSGGGQFVDRNTVALVETPERTDSWKPVPHIAVIEAVPEVVNAHHWTITEEQFWLAHEWQKLFGVMKSNTTACSLFNRNRSDRFQSEEKIRKPGSEIPYAGDSAAPLGLASWEKLVARGCIPCGDSAAGLCSYAPLGLIRKPT